MAFNAHHSPIGAYASLTLGTPGRSGLGLESGMPPEHELLVGLQAPDGTFEALPFFVGRPGDPLRELAPVTRDFGLTADTWAATGASLRVVSPLRSVPEPEVAAPPSSATRSSPPCSPSSRSTTSSATRRSGRSSACAPPPGPAAPRRG